MESQQWEASGWFIYAIHMHLTDQCKCYCYPPTFQVTPSGWWNLEQESELCETFLAAAELVQRACKVSEWDYWESLPSVWCTNIFHHFAVDMCVEEWAQWCRVCWGVVSQIVASRQICVSQPGFVLTHVGRLLWNIRAVSHRKVEHISNAKSNQLLTFVHLTI